MGLQTEHELTTIDGSNGVGEKFAQNGLPTAAPVADVQPFENESDERDAADLARLGKKSVLRRRFGFLSILGFTCTILITWEGQLILFTTGLTNGGSAGLVYEYIFSWIGTLSVFSTMAEMASMAPTAGGQYHWMTMLAPKRARVFLSYIMGWLVICGWQSILASGGFFAGTMIEGLIQLNYPSYVPQNWHGTLLFWSILIFAIFINTVTSKVLPKIEAFILILHIVGFFAVMIPLVYLAPQKQSAHEVFTVFTNGGGWPSNGLSFFIGTLGTVFAMFGCDSAVHMAEEIKNASTVVPWSMIITTLLNGTLGFGMVIAVLFVTMDIDDALTSPTGLLGYPYMQIFVEATGSVGGASTMIAIVIIMDSFGTIAFLATASRMVWAFARDRGLPGWRFASRVLPSSTIPLYAVLTTSIVACLIGLINIGSTTAFNDVVSLSVSSLYASYIITESLLLWRRCTGAIKRPNEPATHTGEPNELIWGPFHIPGILGILINIYSVMFGIIVFFFSLWPVETPITAAKMNFSVLMTGFVVIVAIAYYLIVARKEFKGPIIEVQPHANAGSNSNSHESA